MEEKALWPKAVYLETSILYQLPADVTTAELLRLKELCNLLEIPIVIPMVAWDEWVALRKKQFTEKVKDYERSREKITNLAEKYSIPINLPSFDSLISPKDNEMLRAEIETMLSSRLKDMGVTITTTPDIPLSLLVKMSIDKTRPFEEKGEKGFRDSLILFTILGFAKQISDGFHLLITDDQVFHHADVSQIAKDRKISLVVVNSIQSAIDNLETFIDKVIRESDAKRTKLLEDYLNGQRQKISHFLRIQDSFSGLFPLFKSEGAFGPRDVKAITSVDLLDIHDPTPGILPEGVKKDRVKISFSAKVKLSLLINQYASLSSLAKMVYGPRFEFNTDTGVWEPKYQAEDYQPTEIASTIERDLKIEASAILDRDEGEYSELQLERIV